MSALTSDPQVDAVAAAIAAAHIPSYQWPRLGDEARYRFRRMATAAITVLGRTTR